MSTRYIYGSFPNNFQPAGCPTVDHLFPRELNDIVFANYPTLSIMGYNGISNSTSTTQPGSLLPQMCGMDVPSSSVWMDCEAPAESCQLGLDYNTFQGLSYTPFVSYEGLQENSAVGNGNFGQLWTIASNSLSRLLFIEVYPSDFSAGNVAALTTAHNALTGDTLPVPSSTPTPTPSLTATPSPSSTPSSTPTATPTPSPTASLTPSATPTPVPTNTPTPTPTPTSTAGFITLDGLPAHGTAFSKTQISAGLPSPVGGLSDGDWAGCLVSANTSATLTPPAQYTLVPNTLQTSSSITTGVYYHIWHAGDPTSGLVFQTSVSGNLSYICGTYRGVNQSIPFDGSGSQHNSASNTATSPTVNGNTNDMLLMLYGIVGSSHTFTAVSEGTIESSLSSGPAAAWIDFQLTTGGATGSQSATFTGNVNSNNGIQIALLPGP